LAIHNELKINFNDFTEVTSVIIINLDPTSKVTINGQTFENVAAHSKKFATHTESGLYTWESGFFVQHSAEPAK